MLENYSKIMNHKLFNGIIEADFTSMLTCLGAFEKSYYKSELILNEGESVTFVGVVLAGAVKIVHSDCNGEEVIIAKVSEGEIFAEVFACAEIGQSPVSIIATTKSTILFLNYGKIIATCNNSCRFHQQLISNMLKVVASKTLFLNKRIEIISKKTLREKILTYLYNESSGRKKFSIPMNREELANFLCADRSALSNELSKMKKEGLIDYYKNEFKLSI